MMEANFKGEQYLRGKQLSNGFRTIVRHHFDVVALYVSHCLELELKIEDVTVRKVCFYIKSISLVLVRV